MLTNPGNSLSFACGANKLLYAHDIQCNLCKVIPREKKRALNSPIILRRILLKYSRKSINICQKYAALYLYRENINF